MVPAVSRWFRSYTDKHRNAKVAKLTDADFRLWDQLLCIAAENDGLIPPLEGLKSLLKRRLDHLSLAVDRLVNDGLIDPSDTGFTPHNWLKKQYKSDVSTDRVKRFRNGQRNVSVTPPDTETESDTEKKEEGGGKPPNSYAFFGQTIRLKPSDLEKWRRTYHAIGDVEAELSTIDAWWRTQEPDERKQWFHRTMGMLNRKHQELLATAKKGDGYDPHDPNFRLTV
jgi:hypothetical protein